MRVKYPSAVVLVTQSCLTRGHSMDCSLPSSSVHVILQARTLEWVAIPFSRGSSQPRNQTQVSCITGGFFTIWATGEAYIPISIRDQILRSCHVHQVSELCFYCSSWSNHWLIRLMVASLSKYVYLCVVCVLNSTTVSLVWQSAASTYL